jgi:hypothetical protein
MFISHVFKTEYMKFDKITKTNFVETDLEILKVFSQITKLIRINNMYNINSITVRQIKLKNIPNCYIFSFRIFTFSNL